MLEVAGDLRRAPANFENPGDSKFCAYFRLTTLRSPRGLTLICLIPRSTQNQLKSLPYL